VDTGKISGEKGIEDSMSNPFKGKNKRIDRPLEMTSDVKQKCGIYVLP